MNEKDFIHKLRKKFKLKGKIQKRQIWVEIRSDDLLKLCNYTKEIGFRHLSTISVTDLIHIGKYELVYFLWSYENKTVLIIKTIVSRKRPVIKSVSSVWGEGQIHERELHELFGVEFKGNPDLSALFLEEWKQNPPFKKDFDWRKYVRKKYYTNNGSEKAYFEAGK